MLARLRSRLTYANVMATVAVFIALGGTSIAAINLTRGSVKGKHVARNAITSPKVKNRALRAIDFARGQLPAGPQGPTGPPGAANPNAETLDGFDSSAFALVGHGHPGPAFRFANTASGTDLDVDTQPVICPTSAYSPPANERAWIDGWAAVEPTAGSLTVAVILVYSTNNGTSWTDVGPGTTFAPRDGISTDNEWASASNVSALPLTAGTQYLFAVRLDRGGGGSADADSHRCAVRVQVTPDA